MSIYSALHHRANVTRAAKSANGDMQWQQVLSTLPCLLSVDGFQEKQTDGDKASLADGTALLITAPNLGLKPNDRVFLTRGAVGQWRVVPQSRTASTLNQLHHDEYRVEQVTTP